MRKHNVKDIHLTITDVEPFVNERHSGVIISWDSDIGFGEYTIYKEGNTWHADTETMDHGEDKEFGRELLKLWMDRIKID